MRALNLLIKTVQSRNKRDLLDAKARLSCLTHSTSLVDELLEECWSAFYVLSGKSFVGIDFDCSRRLETIRERHFGERISISNFFEKLRELEGDAYPTSPSSLESLVRISDSKLR